MASKPGRLIRYIHDRLLPKHKKETTSSSEEISQTSLRNFQQDTAYQEMISPGEVPSPGTDGLILLFQLEEFNQEEENSVQCPCNDYFPPLWLVPWFDFTHFNYNNYKIVSNKLLNSLNDDSLPINSCIVELPIASNSFSSGVTIFISTNLVIIWNYNCIINEHTQLYNSVDRYISDKCQIHLINTSFERSYHVPSNYYSFQEKIESVRNFNKSNKKEGKRKETPRKRKLCSSLFSRIKGKGFNS